MKRPRVIFELHSYLGILLRSGLRAGAGDPGAVLLDIAADIEREGPAPAFCLQLYRIAPERRAPASTSIAETTDASSGVRLEVRRPPLWVACRHLLVFRGRGIEEELEMVAAALRTLHDHPVITGEHIPSLRGGTAVERFPLEILDDREAWREAGLSRPRLNVTFGTVVPIVSALGDPLDRVLDREIRIGEMP